MNQISVPSPATINAPTPKKKSGGCGCLIYGLLALGLVSILAVVGAYYAVKGFVKGLTSDAPVKIVQVELTQSEIDKAKDKFNQLIASAETADGKSYQFSAEDLNALLRIDPEFAKIGEQISVEFREKTIVYKGSLELSKFGFGGRYLNGEVELDPSFSDSKADLRIVGFNILSIPQSKDIAKQIKDKNLVSEIDKNSQAYRIIQGIESIELKEKILNVKIRAK
jgi:hypothetical protein